MSELWAGAVSGFVVGAAVSFLVSLLLSMDEVPRDKRTKVLDCRACGDTFMGRHKCKGINP